MVKIIIVNEKDEIIGYKERGTLDKQDIYRVSALWIINSQNKILLAKRHHTKLNNPEKWGPAVAGTVDENETYEQNIIKEAEEELGLKNIKLKIGPKTKMENKHNHFTQGYLTTIDKNISEFKIQEEEVEEIKWFSSKELEEQINDFPEKFLPEFRKYFEIFCKKESKTL